MKLSQFAYFIAVVDNGSFSHAATQLCVSQSSVSQTIQNLEHELGFQLLKRSKEGVEVTEMGSLVYKDAKELLESMNEKAARWQQVYQDMSSLNGTVRIGVVPGTHPILLHCIVAKIKETSPNISFKIVEARDYMLPKMLADMKLDIIISDCIQEDFQGWQAFAKENNIYIEKLCDDEYKIAVGKDSPLAKKRDLDHQDIKDISLACYVGGDQAAERFLQVGFDEDKMIEYTSIEKMIEHARSGMGVSVLPEGSVTFGQSIFNGNKSEIRFVTVEGISVPFIHFIAVKDLVQISRETEIVLNTTKQFFAEKF